jgi:hypothetical protein
MGSMGRDRGKDERSALSFSQPHDAAGLPLCLLCADVVGMYEPALILGPQGEWSPFTSIAAERGATTPGLLFHADCLPDVAPRFDR